MTMQQIRIVILLLAGIMIASCSPRVDDIFEKTSITRLNNNRDSVRNRLMQAENGWVMEYFPRSQSTLSSPDQHKGYTFIMEFKEDGTVTIGGIVDGMYKTETSLWDVISDNSSVLTFNSYNSIFHLYSNPDPEFELFNVDGIGYGGDYEFMILSYNHEDNCQMLLGKKNYTYTTLTPLAKGVEWEDYFQLVDNMQQRLFAEDCPLDMHIGDFRATLYNANKMEFRAFKYGADTLGGGAYYGFIVNPKGIRMTDTEILEHTISNRPFVLTEDGRRLVSKNNQNTYITVDGADVFVDYPQKTKNWNIDMTSLPPNMQHAVQLINDSMSIKIKNTQITNLRWEGYGKDKMGLCITYTYQNKGETKSGNGTYYYTIKNENNQITLSYTGEFKKNSIIHTYRGQELIDAFNGTYVIDLIQGFAPAKGLIMRPTNQPTAQLLLTL